MLVNENNNTITYTFKEVKKEIDDLRSQIEQEKIKCHQDRLAYNKMNYLEIDIRRLYIVLKEMLDNGVLELIKDLNHETTITINI